MINEIMNNCGTTDPSEAKIALEDLNRELFIVNE